MARPAVVGEVAAARPAEAGGAAVVPQVEAGALVAPGVAGVPAVHTAVGAHVARTVAMEATARPEVM